MTYWPELMKNEVKSTKLRGRNSKNHSFSHDLGRRMSYFSIMMNSTYILTCWPELMKNERKNMKLRGQNPKNHSFSHDLGRRMSYFSIQ